MQTEIDLIKGIQRGSRAAFQQLVEQNQKSIYYLALRLSGNHEEAEDLAQDVFVKCFHSIDSFRLDARISSWLYRITVNTFIDKKRKKQVETMHISNKIESNDQIAEPADTGIIADTERSTESLLIREQIETALNKLSPKEKSAFVLKHYEGLTIREIADIIKTSDGTVKSLLFRAIKKLQKSLVIYKNEFGLGKA